MLRSTWSPSPSPSSSSNSANSLKQVDIDKITAKCLVDIPLVLPPVINCENLQLLNQAEFVNVVFEKVVDSNAKAFFRVSNENNKDVLRIIPHRQADRRPQKKGLKYLECCDMQGCCILYVAYPVGLGEVTLLSSTEELVGECHSNVEFICLSVKVKYNFYDSNGNRLMKMTAIMPEEGSGNKFKLMVKSSKSEKLALIKMGSLKSCCQIKFKSDHISVLERLQIIALWTGFMHNEMEDTEACILLDKQAQVIKEKESRRKKSFIADTIGVNGDLRKSSESDNTVPLNVTDNITVHHEASKNADVSNKSKTTTEKVKLWKNLVTAQFSRRQHNDNNCQEYGSNNNVSDLNNGNINIEKNQVIETQFISKPFHRNAYKF